MSNPWLGQIMAVGFNFPPRGWVFCDGQILPINQYQALYSLLGTTYGGDGRTTFALPDLRGRSIVDPGDGISWGEKAGVQDSVMSTANVPSHTHGIGANSGTATVDSPTGAYRAQTLDTGGSPLNAYSTTKAGQMAPTDAAGNSAAFTNRSPSLGVYFCIALQGLFPSRN